MPLSVLSCPADRWLVTKAALDGLVVAAKAAHSKPDGEEGAAEKPPTEKRLTRRRPSRLRSPRPRRRSSK